MRKLVGLAVLLAAGAATRMTAQTPGDWDGPCDYQNLPYMGMASDGVSPMWGGYFDQPHTGTCRTMSGMYFDMWMVPAQPGDVFNMAFGGANNTYCALADHDGESSAYVEQYMMMPGMGSMGGMYTAGWTNFTVPASFNHGYMEVWVAKNSSQAHYLIQAVKISSQAAVACTPSVTAMCLDGGRFQVSADWRKATGETGHGNAVSLTADTGYLWFFNSTNVEIVVKVLDACSASGHQWVFAGGLTNVGVTLRVMDTQTGTVKTYQNSEGVAFVPIQDTGAFNCP